MESYSPSTSVRSTPSPSGARLSLLVGFAATAVAVLVATAVGGLSGFVGGRLDLVTQDSSMPGWPFRDCFC